MIPTINDIYNIIGIGFLIVYTTGVSTSPTAKLHFALVLSRGAVQEYSTVALYTHEFKFPQADSLAGDWSSILTPLYCRPLTFHIL
jgi:hypothetical protein